MHTGSAPTTSAAHIHSLREGYYYPGKDSAGGTYNGVLANFGLGLGYQDLSYSQPGTLSG